MSRKFRRVGTEHETIFSTFVGDMNAADPQPSSNCPRCGAAFVCQADRIHVCSCSTVTLTEAQRAYIRAHYSRCLCVRCLVEIQSSTPSNQIE